MRSFSSLSLSLRILKVIEEAQVEWASVLERVSCRGRAFLVAEKNVIRVRRRHATDEGRRRDVLLGKGRCHWGSPILLFCYFRTRLEAKLGVDGFVFGKFPKAAEMISERI
ncbi:hypothetical protein FOQG_01260 [Fusarium oxysporum f. sp. raphani 54005]|uniref:Uncharacterized protein n=4 Tax=Fusarium oxysporum TaxID=5507 RepID=X0DVU4_FUSOX|nr:hypothetical protein FOVG_09102 [Fusarium oxysporum f. sp. pisi HDV247]EXK98312.1 hypothetical protein FOQG_01260 [Fusarium oxysporum f. sp. raphani 54005]EXL88308.1 hypothetical protein FOPG_00644 [Fusarium oxysporum f. sp. conglutinans race 2 54008]EXM35515.1 hypothetical protein FOTG_01941 [Fusarium oxysporum f. sp. vasinfectum 25433]KAI8408180.1 hypothetical protein FOFC_11115 [Fusarium oxysporum]